MKLEKISEAYKIFKELENINYLLKFINNNEYDLKIIFEYKNFNTLSVEPLIVDDNLKEHLINYYTNKKLTLLTKIEKL